MGRPRTLERKYNYQYVTERHHEIIRMVLLGMENREIAGALGITPQTVSNVRQNPLAQQYIQTLTVARDAGACDMSKVLMQTATKGLQYLHELINDQHDEEGVGPALKVKVAQDALSRIGMSPIVRTHQINEERISPEILDMMKERAEQAKAARSVDAEYEVQQERKVG